MPALSRLPEDLIGWQIKQCLCVNVAVGQVRVARQPGERDLASLRADRWVAAHPEAIRPHRVEEARYKADAATTRLARRSLLEKAS